MAARDADKLLSHGETFVANAREALDRRILREEQLYMWENPLLALDEFLCDSEDAAANHEALADQRLAARELKGQLEKQIAEFLGEEIVMDPDADVEGLLAVGMELADSAEAALKKNAKDATVWEEPLIGIKSWLADSEIHEPHPVIAMARPDMKRIRDDLEARVEQFNQDWADQDKKAGY